LTLLYIQGIIFLGFLETTIQTIGVNHGGN